MNRVDVTPAVPGDEDLFSMTLSDWIAAQGHGAYVAGSYAVGALLAAVEVWRLHRRHARALADARHALGDDA